MTFHHSHFIAGDTSKTPLLLLHGTGADEFDLIPLAQDIAPEAPVFTVRGNVVEHGQKRYFHRNPDGSFNQEDLAKRTQELADFIRDTAPTHGIDLSRLVALGFSNGANIASALFFRRPEVLRGGILLRGMVPFLPENVSLTGKDILLMAGEQDPLIPVASATQLAELYRKAGANIAFHTLPTGHGLIERDVIEARNWYNSLR